MKTKIVLPVPSEHIENGKEPEFYRTSGLQLMVLPELEWAVPGFVPVGLTMLVAHSKIGKTFLAQDVAVAVATGGCAWGKVKVEKGPVLYVDTEGNKRRVHRRLSALLGSEPWPEHLWVTHRCVTLDAEGLEWLGAQLGVEHLGTRLLVLDTLNAMRLGRTKGGDLVKEDYDLIRALRALGEQHDCAILLIHHSSLSTKSDTVNAGAGTHGLAAAASAVLTFQRTRCEHDAVMYATGNDLETEGKWHFTRDTRTGFWTLQGAGEHFMKTSQRQQVFDLLLEKGSMTPAAIAAALGKDRAMIKNLLQRMHKDGDLERTDGFYSVPATRQ